MGTPTAPLASEVAGRLTRWLKSHTAATAFPQSSSSMLSGSICVSRSAIETSRISSPNVGSTAPMKQSEAVIARRLRRPRPRDRWHLDEIVVRIAGERIYLWRAVDHEGHVLDMLVQRRRNCRAALRLMRKLLKSKDLCRTCW